MYPGRKRGIIGCFQWTCSAVFLCGCMILTFHWLGAESVWPLRMCEHRSLESCKRHPLCKTFTPQSPNFMAFRSMSLLLNNLNWYLGSVHGWVTPSVLVQCMGLSVSNAEQSASRMHSHCISALLALGLLGLKGPWKKVCLGEEELLSESGAPDHAMCFFCSQPCLKLCRPTEHSP